MRDSDNGSDWHAQETYKSLIGISVNALRFAVFANGGAAVALLAFLGQAHSITIDLSSVKSAMTMFIVGIALGGLAHLTSYLTQLRLYGESALGIPQTGLLRHNTFLYLTMALLVASIAAFACGAWTGAVALSVVAGET